MAHAASYLLSTTITIFSGGVESVPAIAHGIQLIDSADGKKVCQLLEKRFHRGQVTVVEGVSFSETEFKPAQRMMQEKRESSCTPIHP